MVSYSVNCDHGRGDFPIYRGLRTPNFNYSTLLIAACELEDELEERLGLPKTFVFRTPSKIATTNFSFS
ncbi:unnamed protein product [Allacma fusca]|uniref:Uncharacterized protein n=1 Tax=Allacma fusca TaxID=39272 RepID=A0A8J2K8D3_9HEXA|nr:unnamed protein product [Allacma fusca]